MSKNNCLQLYNNTVLSFSICRPIICLGRPIKHKNYLFRNINFKSFKTLYISRPYKFKTNLLNHIYFYHETNTNEITKNYKEEFLN